jgi:predicted ATP-grasp superfamily ATP-dependent carboligase
MDRSRVVLIAAAAGRALAASAYRAGFVPLVADFFGDQDTLALARAHVRLDASRERGMDAQELLAALEALEKIARPCGIVCGTGFEDRPELLDQIARRWTLYGNGAEAVARLKDPIAFAALCRAENIPHPETCSDEPADPAEWLIKRRGGAGGGHVRRARRSNIIDRSLYYQRRVTGMPISALLLANGRRALILGWSAQWSSPTASGLFRYGGAVRPAPIESKTAGALAAALQRLVATARLVGLNSADFLVDRDKFWLLEINPRPGATLDIFEPRDRTLFALHLQACRETLPTVAAKLEDAAAAAIVYADRDISSVPAIVWPAWTADRPRPGISVRSGEPLCTVRSNAATAAAARALVRERGLMVLAEMTGNNGRANVA